jgi:hypothetical protein
MSGGASASVGQEATARPSKLSMFLLVAVLVVGAVFVYQEGYFGGSTAVTPDKSEVGEVSGPAVVTPTESEVDPKALAKAQKLLDLAFDHAVGFEGD